MTGLCSIHTQHCLPDMGLCAMDTVSLSLGKDGFIYKLTLNYSRSIYVYYTSPPTSSSHMYIHIYISIFESLEYMFQPEFLFPVSVYTQKAFLSEGIFLVIGRDSKEMQALRK